MKFWHLIIIAIVLGGFEAAMRHAGISHHITGMCDYLVGVAFGIWVMRK